MNLLWLSTFRNVVEEGSYSAAAIKHFVSQSAISQQMKQLESFVGAKLVRRSGRDLKLTEGGQVLYELACRFEDDLNATLRTIQDLNCVPSNNVTVASTFTPLIYYLPPVLSRFWADLPEVSVKTLVRMDREVIRAIKDGEADIGILMGPHTDNALVSLPLTEERIIAICNPSHAFATMKCIRAADFAEQRIATSRVGAPSRDLLDHWFLERGVKLRHISELFSRSEIRATVLENPAIGFVERYCVEEDLKFGRLFEVDMEDFSVSRTLYLTHRPDIRSNEKHLVDLLLQHSQCHL